MNGEKERNASTAKTRKKTSKAQLQLAVIKKKQCDAIALSIVKRLIEHDVQEQWLLENLKYIAQTHMDDVIEERAIAKTCGYVLCDEALTVVAKQRYHICTQLNQVFDISKKKNFCSPRCYRASNYLQEQILSSPLWLRDKEHVPEFKLLHQDAFHVLQVGSVTDDISIHYQV